MQWLYLLVNVCSVIVPFLYSFHPKISFQKKWLALLPAIVISCAFFVAWDVQFTFLKVWGFNSDYIIGIYCFNLPVEEILFFICIPYACTFTYYALNKLSWKNKNAKPVNTFSVLLGVTLLIFAVVNYSRLYTFYACFFTGWFLIFFRNRIEKAFYMSYLILLIPFFIVNGILTGSGLEKPIVWYNNEENLSLRIFTIPVEDAVYGMLLIFMNILIFKTADEYISSKKSKLTASF